MTLTVEAAERLTHLLIEGLQEKKAKNVVRMDLRKVSDAVTDFFIVCHGDSTTQVRALADSAEDMVRQATGERPWHREGMLNSQWVVLDYGNVVAHIFLPDRREFYALEDLWNDAEVTEFEDVY